MKEIEKLKKEKEQYINSVDVLKKGRSRFDLKYWFQQIKRKIRKYDTILVNMELANGFHRTFLVADSGSFTFRNREYVIDDKDKYYNVDAKIFCIDYHENISIPVRRQIPFDTITKTLDTDELYNKLVYSINPENLKRFTKGNVIEQILKSAQLDTAFKKITFLLIITMISAVIHLVLFLYQSGFFNDIGNIV